MPWLYFDLIVNDETKYQGDMILEDMAGARDRADALAIELLLAKPELEGKHGCVRVLDENNVEVYRTPINPALKNGVQFRSES
jgi:hypothetical protein